jgi:probable rRNA maturation factor
MEEPPSYHSITVLNHSSLPADNLRIERAVWMCLEIAKAIPSNVTVLLTEDDRVQELNRNFRKMDVCTDVLTFPDEEFPSGDVAIAAPYAARQAEARGIDFQDELVLLAIHGTLHLLGLNDETESGRLDMIRRMYDVADYLGIDKSDDWGSLLHDAVGA